MSSLSIGHAINVILRALIPIFGIAFLGWSGTKLLVVYLADTLASLYGVAMLALYAGILRGAEYQAWIAAGLTLGKRLRTGIGVALAPIPFLLIVGFFFGVLPLFVMLDMQNVFWREFLTDRDLWIAVGCQFAAAMGLLSNQLKFAREIDDPTRLFRHQIALFGARWGAMILIGFFLAAYIPRSIYGALLIVTYALATIALELAPERSLELIARVTGRSGKPAGARVAPASIAAQQETRPRPVATRAPATSASGAERARPAVDTQGDGRVRRLPSWLLLLFAAAFAVLCAIGSWNALDVALHGVAAPARVIEHHATSARSASIVGQVEVAIPGQRAFRTEVYDGWGVGTWADGGTIDLVCLKARTDFPQCEVHSTWSRWLLPSVFLLIGLGFAYLWRRASN